MQIVVKINDKEYLDIKKHPGDITSYITTVHLYDAIRNGTPLPKGHGSLKDENEMKQIIEDAKVESESSKNFAENIIKFAPTIIEADNAEGEVKDN